MSRRQGCELSIDFYKKFHMTDTIISYASLKPRVEPRLQEICRKFASKLIEYEHELKDNFQLKGKFDPKQVREDIKKRQMRQDQMASLRNQVEAEIERVYSNKETKERTSVLSRKPMGQASGKGGSSVQLNEDLMDLGTIEVSDDIEPPKFQPAQTAIEETDDFDFVEVENSDDQESEISLREDLSGSSYSDEENNSGFEESKSFVEGDKALPDEDILLNNRKEDDNQRCAQQNE